MNPVMTVRHAVDGATGVSLGRGCWVWCPGCDEAHRFTLVDEDGTVPPGPTWEWEGDLEHPTISPSLLVTWTEGPERTPRTCHSFIRAGRWEFLSDCTHQLAGQTVDMVPVPDWLLMEATQ